MCGDVVVWPVMSVANTKAALGLCVCVCVCDTHSKTKSPCVFSFCGGGSQCGIHTMTLFLLCFGGDYLDVDKSGAVFVQVSLLRWLEMNSQRSLLIP